MCYAGVKMSHLTWLGAKYRELNGFLRGEFTKKGGEGKVSITPL